MPDVPNVWTDGCLVLDKVTGVSSSGSVFFFLHISLSFLGVHVRGAKLIMLALLGVKGSLVGVCVRFLGFYRLYRGLSCGVSSWLFSLPMLCIWEQSECGSSCWATVGRSWRLFSV